MGGLFGGGDVPAPQPIPVPEKPKPTPMVDEAAIARKKKQVFTANQQRGGRASTILSDTETLG